MKKTGKRLTALLLAFAMAISMAVPLSFASSLDNNANGVVTYEDDGDNNVISYSSDESEGNSLVGLADNSQKSANKESDAGDSSTTQNTSTEKETKTSNGSDSAEGQGSVDNSPVETSAAYQDDNDSLTGLSDSTESEQESDLIDLPLVEQAQQEWIREHSTTAESDDEDAPQPVPVKKGKMLKALGAGGGLLGAVSPTVNPESGVTVNRSTDDKTTFNANNVSEGQVWSDKSVEPLSGSNTGFKETLSIFAKAKDDSVEHTYGGGNYVIVLDVTRSLFSAEPTPDADNILQAEVNAANDIIAEISKNPTAKLAVVGFGGDNKSDWKRGAHDEDWKYNEPGSTTTVYLPMKHWDNPPKLQAYYSGTSDSNSVHKWGIKVQIPGEDDPRDRKLTYGTHTQAGIARGAKILEDNADKTKNGFMIVLSDGVPTYGNSHWKKTWDDTDDDGHRYYETNGSGTTGEGKGADGLGAGYTLLTAQYFKNRLKGKYKNFEMYSGLFSNEDSSSSDYLGKLYCAMWALGVGNNKTYDAGASGTSNGYHGSLFTTGYPADRLLEAWKNKDNGLSSDDRELTKGWNKVDEILTNDVRTSLGIPTQADANEGQSDERRFPTPFKAQFANLSDESSRSAKKKALQNMFENIQVDMVKDKVEEKTEPLKAGTNVTFTTSTGNNLKVKGDPILVYNGSNKTHSSKSGDTYTYSIEGSTCTVKIEQNTNNSKVTCTIPAALVNKNAMDNHTKPVQCVFNVDLTTTDYMQLYNTTKGDFTTYSNVYSSGNESKVTYTPVMAQTAKTNNKSSNTTGTLAYTSSRQKINANTQGTETLGNNGKLTVTFDWANIELNVYELDQANTERRLPEVEYSLLKTDGSVVTLRGTQLKFNSTTTNPATINGIEPGNYILRATSVPSGHVKPADVAVAVQKKHDKQSYKIDVPTTRVRVWAYDKFTGEKIPQNGVKVKIVNKATGQIAKIPNWNVASGSVSRSGEIECKDINLEYVRERFPVGNYQIVATTVPSRYRYPTSPTEMKVLEQRPEQQYKLPLEHLGSLIIHKRDEYGNPMANVQFELRDANGNVVLPVQKTNSNGVATFIDSDKLTVGDYYLTELKTNNGKTLLAHQIKITIPMVMTDAEFANAHPNYKEGQVGNVNQDTDILNTDKSLAWHDTTNHRWAIYDLNYDVDNAHTYPLPATGSDQPVMFRITAAVGMLGLLAAAAFIAKKKVLDIE